MVLKYRKKMGKKKSKRQSSQKKNRSLKNKLKHRGSRSRSRSKSNSRKLRGGAGETRDRGLPDNKLEIINEKLGEVKVGKKLHLVSIKKNDTTEHKI